MKTSVLFGVVFTVLAFSAMAGQLAQIAGQCNQLAQEVSTDLSTHKITQDDADKLNARIKQVQDQASSELSTNKGMLKRMWQDVNRIQKDLTALESGTSTGSSGDPDPFASPSPSR